MDRQSYKQLYNTALSELEIVRGHYLHDQKLITQHLTTIQELQKQYEDLMGDLQVAAWANLDLESKVKYLKDDAKTDTQQRLKSVAINHTLHEVIRTIIQTYHKD